MSTGERLPLGLRGILALPERSCLCGHGSTESKAPGHEVRHAAGSPGVLAVGEVRGGNVKRVASAVGEGSMCIAFVQQVLHE
jgi:thioredoxin reductase (NADPH)